MIKYVLYIYYKLYDIKEICIRSTFVDYMLVYSYMFDHIPNLINLLFSTYPQFTYPLYEYSVKFTPHSLSNEIMAEFFLNPQQSTILF